MPSEISRSVVCSGLIFQTALIEYPPFSKVYPSKPIIENFTLSSMEEFEAMLHLTFVNDFTVSNNSFQSRANPNPILAKPQRPPFKINSSHFFLFLLLPNFSDDPFLYPNSVIMTALKLIYPKTVLFMKHIHIIGIGGTFYGRRSGYCQRSRF